MNVLEQQECKHTFVKRRKRVMSHEKSELMFMDTLLILKCTTCEKRTTVDLLERKVF